MSKKKTAYAISKLLLNHSLSANADPVKKLVKDMTGVGFLTPDESIDAAFIISGLLKLDHAAIKNGEILGVEASRFLDISPTGKNYMLTRMLSHGLAENDYTLTSVADFNTYGRGHVPNLHDVDFEEQVVCDFGKSRTRRRMVTMMKRKDISFIYDSILNSIMNLYIDRGNTTLLESMYADHVKMSGNLSLDRICWFMSRFCVCPEDRRLEAAQNLRGVNPNSLRDKEMRFFGRDSNGTPSEKETLVYIDITHDFKEPEPSSSNRHAAQSRNLNGATFTVKVNSVRLDPRLEETDKILVLGGNIDRFQYEVIQFLNRDEKGSVIY